MAEAYEMLGNYPLSTKYYKAYAAAQVDFVTALLTNESREKVLAKESENALLIKQNEIDKQKWWVISGFCIAVLFLLGILIVYYFFKREQKIKQELANLNATKDKLFAILSHDLISPVDTLKNYTMLMDWGAMTQEKFSESMQRLKPVLNNTSNMLENVLHWAISQMTEIKPKKEAVNISTIVSEQIDLVAPIAKDKGIDIKQNIPTDLMLTVDKNHLALVIRNLLQNALKFTNSGGDIQFKGQNTEGGV